MHWLPYFYYDAVILIAMGLEYAAARGSPSPHAYELHASVLEMSSEATERGHWSHLRDVLKILAQARPLAYTGAAAEYQFDQFGAAKHLVFDSWRVERQTYVNDGTLQARCLRQPK